MSVTPTAGTITPTTPGTLTVYVNPANLAAGTYNASIVITGGGGSAIVQVTFSVGGGGGGGTGGGLTASPGSLTMSAPLGSTTTVIQYISLTGGLPFNAYATTSTGAGWLSVTPTSGTAPTSLSCAGESGRRFHRQLLGHHHGLHLARFPFDSGDVQRGNFRGRCNSGFAEHPELLGANWGDGAAGAVRVRNAVRPATLPISAPPRRPHPEAVGCPSPRPAA